MIHLQKVINQSTRKFCKDKSQNDNMIWLQNTIAMYGQNMHIHDQTNKWDIQFCKGAGENMHIHDQANKWNIQFCSESQMKLS